MQIPVENAIDYYGKVRIYGASLQHLETETKNRESELRTCFTEQEEQVFDIKTKTDTINATRRGDIILYADNAGYIHLEKPLPCIRGMPRPDADAY